MDSKKGKTRRGFIKEVSAGAVAGATLANLGCSSGAGGGKVSFEVLNPQVELAAPPEVAATSPRLDGIDGKGIGLVWEGKSGGEFFFDALEALLKKKYPSVKVVRYTIGVNDAEARIPKEVDAFVAGVGDSGMGAAESVAWTIRMEKRGKPGVAVFGKHLMYNAQEAARLSGMPSVRMAPVPDMEFYPNRYSAQSMLPCAEAVLDDVVDALTRPARDAETQDAAPRPEALPETVTVSGDSLESACERFYQLAMDNGWGDGLPLVPPTPSSVEKMLRATSLPPDAALGDEVPLHMGDAAVKATVKKVAVNAVMAGAKPEYFPVVVAAMQGIMNKGFSHHVFTSDGSFNLLIAVSGPLARKIGMNAGMGLLGYGWRANNTIGRAVRLSMCNIANYKPGKLDTALTGRASSHTFYVMAENDELSPWEPYHTLRGFQAGDSCVTVSGVGLGDGIGWGWDFSGYGGGTGIAWSPDGVLESIVKSIASHRDMFSSYMPGIGTGAMVRPLNYVFVLSPDLAYQLNKRGFTRKGLHDYIMDKTSIPYEQMTRQEVEGLKRRLSEKTTAFGGTDNIPDDRIPVYWDNLKPGGKVPVVTSPDNLNIFVAGAASGYNFGALYLLGAHEVVRIP
ncbi:MAG: twin-arginine translocation signal domain-containing protein [Acidobacteriota bacterium]|nr:twin-arginine translocation signal domain-containing protein [Acidobacteriota bacterium]